MNSYGSNPKFQFLRTSSMGKIVPIEENSNEKTKIIQALMKTGQAIPS